MSASPLRVGILGARRVRQGLGPFIARDFVAAGARIVAVAGTTQTTADQAAAEVERVAGAAPKAVVGMDALLAESLDVACILSPAGTHGDHVEAALAAGCHVLAEKPFLWEPETEWETRARDLEDRFAAAGRILGVNAQWPWVLPAFRELTGKDPLGARSLEMGMSPASEGLRMVGDALPHPLSLAQAMRPDLVRIEDVAFDHPSPAELHLRATCHGEGDPMALEVHFGGHITETPRPAWFAIDGQRADRCVRTRDYSMFLRSGARLVDMPDPMGLRIHAFVEQVKATNGAPLEPDRTVSRRAHMLHAVAEAYRSEFGS